ncbi:hypothetical protein CKJ83_03785 [Corynebacterium hadale]|nr:hypothetical protein CKJ83_03785 [Corynebacterium hadale]
MFDWPSRNELKTAFGARQRFNAELHAFKAVLCFPATFDPIIEQFRGKTVRRYADFYALQWIRT